MQVSLCSLYLKNSFTAFTGGWENLQAIIPGGSSVPLLPKKWVALSPPHPLPPSFSLLTHPTVLLTLVTSSPPSPPPLLITFPPHPLSLIPPPFLHTPSPPHPLPSHPHPSPPHPLPSTPPLSHKDLWWCSHGLWCTGSGAQWSRYGCCYCHGQECWRDRLHSTTDSLLQTWELWAG